jgi:5-methylcytosine-specific restriction endonuclease McrA
MSSEINKTNKSIKPIKTERQISHKITYKKKSIPKSLKKQVWDKWIGPNIGRTKCLCCKHEEIRQIEFHCGHIIAEVNGGKTNVDNLRPICAQCNLSMGSMSMDEFRKTYFDKNII